MVTVHICACRAANLGIARYKKSKKVSLFCLNVADEIIYTYWWAFSLAHPWDAFLRSDNCVIIFFFRHGKNKQIQIRREKNENAFPNRYMRWTSQTHPVKSDQNSFFSIRVAYFSHLLYNPACFFVKYHNCSHVTHLSLIKNNIL